MLALQLRSLMLQASYVLRWWKFFLQPIRAQLRAFCKGRQIFHFNPIAESELCWTRLVAASETPCKT